MKPIELTKELFQPYGQILKVCPPETKSSEDQDCAYWSKVTQFKLSEDVSTGILVGKKREPVYTKMERHFHTPEMIVALDADAVLFVALPDDEKEKPEGIKMFSLKKGQGVVLNRGTWHFAPYPVDADGVSCLIVFKNNTETEDLYFADLDAPVEIEL